GEQAGGQQKGGGQPKEGGQGGKAAGEQAGGPPNESMNGAPGGENRGGTANPNGPAPAGSQTGSGNAGGGSGDLTPDEANLEDKCQAANLVLKQLQEELDRGQVDPELLKELGWTEEQMRKFAERLSQELNRSDPPDTPEEQ